MTWSLPMWICRSCTRLMATRDTFSAPVNPAQSAAPKKAFRITHHKNTGRDSKAAHSKHEGATPKCTPTLPLHNLHNGKSSHRRPHMQQRHRNKMAVVAKRRRHGRTSALRHRFTTKPAWCSCASSRIASKGKSSVKEEMEG